MPRAAKLQEYDILFEAKARENLELILAERPRTLIMVWEDEHKVHCMGQPHSRGVIGGVLMRLLSGLKICEPAGIFNAG